MPEVSIVTVNPMIGENSAQPGQFRLVATTNGPLQIGLEVSGTAIESVDYAAINHTVWILTGTNEATILIQPLRDTLPEVLESIVLKITNSTARAWPYSQGQMWIHDDEYPVGAFKREVWTNIGGNTIADLINNPRFPNLPDIVETIDSLESDYLTGNSGDNYRQRLSGYTC